MKIAILGYDTEGRASYDHFSARGDEITICDQNSDIDTPHGVATQLGPNYLDNLDRFDLLLRTPGLKPSQILEVNPTVAGKISSGTNEFYASCPTRHIVGVTGTKGKGTTSTLITKILEASGKKVFLGGNIGVPALSFLPEVTADDWVVLELSSFQLIDCRYSPPIATVLMVVPEHLNWHADLQEYIDAKRQLVLQQTADDLVVYNAANETSVNIGESSQARKLPFSVQSADVAGAHLEGDGIVMDGTEICKTLEVALLGNHNLQNICAAVSATWEAVDHDVTAIRSVITTFSGLEHRLELVRTLDDVRYYDDSFGTTPETAIVAIQAFTEPKIVILGGSDKGASFDELAKAVRDSNVRHALLIGDMAEKIEAALVRAGFTQYLPGGSNMTEIVDTAHRLAQPGDVVLLSTGCASFGMFKNYKDRAAQFVAAVKALPE